MTKAFSALNSLAEISDAFTGLYIYNSQFQRLMNLWWTRYIHIPRFRGFLNEFIRYKLILIHPCAYFYI